MGALSLQEKAALYQQAQKLGFDSNGALLNSGIYGKILNLYGQDAAATLPNAGLPAEFLTHFDRRVIDVFFAKTVAEQIGKMYKGGSWEDAFYRTRIREAAGTTRPYSDLSTEQNVHSNNNYVVRQAYRMELVKQWGDLQVAENAKALIDYVSDINVAASHVLAQDLNNIFFYGVSGIQNYGILNDPNLPAYLNPAAIENRIKWQDKSLPEIVTDLTSILSGLYTNAEGWINPDTKLRLALPPSILPVLQGKISALGYSVFQWIKDNLGDGIIENVVIAPQLATPTGNAVMIYASEINGQDVINNVFGEVYKSHGVVRQLSSFVEKVSASSYGAVIRYPFAVARMLGV